MALSIRNNNSSATDISIGSFISTLFESEQFIDLLGSIVSLLSIGTTIRDQVTISIVVIVMLFDTKLLVAIEVNAVEMVRSNKRLSIPRTKSERHSNIMTTTSAAINWRRPVTVTIRFTIAKRTIRTATASRSTMHHNRVMRQNLIAQIVVEIASVPIGTSRQLARCGNSMSPIRQPPENAVVTAFDVASL